MLTLERLTVAYGHVRAVREISLEVAGGELIAIIGPNGAGKSSTLNAIAGIVPIAAGSVSIDGEVVSGQPPDSIVRRGVALVPEGRRVFTRLSVKENLRLAGETLYGKHGRDMTAVFERFPILREFRDRAAGQLSGGQQQMLAIGRALMARPKLLMLDEPSLGLSPQLAGEVLDIVGELRATGTTILVVEQNAKAVLIASRAFVMSNGTLKQLEKDVAQNEAEVLKAYLGSDEMEHDGRRMMGGSNATHAGP